MASLTLFASISSLSFSSLVTCCGEMSRLCSRVGMRYAAWTTLSIGRCSSSMSGTSPSMKLARTSCECSSLCQALRYSSQKAEMVGCFLGGP